MKKGFRQMLDEANAEIEAVSPDQAAALLEDDGTIFVDLRDPREVEQNGRIPGAKHCPRGMLEFWIDPESPYHKPYFASGKSFASVSDGFVKSLSSLLEELKSTDASFVRRDCAEIVPRLHRAQRRDGP